MTTEILLGFEIGTGNPIYMKQAHTVALGMTQAGKTTALEAIISRSGSKALAFKTKRGEAGFNNYHTITPYYKSRADWQYLESILNTALREKVQYQPFMRWAILQVTKGHPATLRAVMQNAHNAQEDKKTARRKEVFEMLESYLQLVVPELERHTFTDKMMLQDGINVMDISDMQTETQQLVIAASIEHIYEHEKNVIVIIPEAWECLPQSRATPVKLVAERFIRKGAAIGDLLYLDSQDIGGIDKQPLRQCDNWIMGRMKEAHEVERLLEQMQGVKVNKFDAFQTLPLGTFYAVLGNKVSKVYVLPAGVPQQMGIDVAKGIISPEAVKSFLKNKIEKKENGDEEMYKELFEKEQEKNKELTEKLKHIISADDLDRALQKVKEQGELIESTTEQLRKSEELREKTAKDTAEIARTAVEQIEKSKNMQADINKFRAAFKTFLFPEGIQGQGMERIADLSEFSAIDLRLTKIEEQLRGELPTGTTTQDINLLVESQVTQIVVEDLPPKEILLPADKPTGKLMAQILQLTKTQPTFTNVQLRQWAAESGVTFDNLTFNKSLAYLLGQSYLIKEDNNYRLPIRLSIKVKEQ